MSRQRAPNGPSRPYYWSSFNPSVNFTAIMIVKNILRIFIQIVAYFLLLSCKVSSQLELRTATAESLLEMVAQSKGEQAVLVNFWATWCAPCVEEFPMIVDLAEQLADSGLTTYFVSVDFLDERERVVNFLISHGVTGISFLKDEMDMPFINGIDENWTGAVPYTVVYGRKNGRAISSWEGPADETKFSVAASRGLYN